MTARSHSIRRARDRATSCSSAPNGGAETVVVADSLEKFEPTFSADGRHISYFVLRDGFANGSGAVMIVDRAASGGWTPPRMLVADLIPFIGAAPLSPDGTLLTFGGVQLTLARTADGARRVLVDSAALRGGAEWPKWSADGSTIYFFRSDNPGPNYETNTEFAAVPVRGGAPRAVLSVDAKRPPFRGQFATDGRRFFFTSPAVESDVFIVELKTRSLER
jgi:hypothetical protein